MCLWLKSSTAQDCSVINVRHANGSVIQSAMSSPCWSLPHVLTSSPPQHVAPPGQHDLLQEDTAHRAPLPEPVQSTSSANEPLSHVNFECGGNPRKTSPTGYEPKELATISPRSLEDIYQLYDVQIEFGEQDQQAPIIEEVKESGVSQLVQTQSFSITRWQRRHLLRRCPTSSPRCTSTSLWKALRTLISKMESYTSC